MNVSYQIRIYLKMTGVLIGISGCAGMTQQRVFLDSSNHNDSPPSWVQSNKISWEDGDKHKFKIEQTVRGNERVNGCYDLARLNGHEAVLTEMAIDIRGKIDNANTSISEDAEIMLDKIRQGQFEGRVTGLKFREQYFERTKVAESERVSCYLLGEMSHSDYLKLQRSIVDKVAAIDPEIRKAIRSSQLDFIRTGANIKVEKITSVEPSKPTTVPVLTKENVAEEKE